MDKMELSACRKNIRYLILDVDGTLTDGKIYMAADKEQMKAFHVKDGLGIGSILPQCGIEAVIITGRKSEIVTRRCEELGIHHIFQGISDKAQRLKLFLKEQGGSLEECAYMGDDINDLVCMDLVSVSACPADAVYEVRNAVDYIAKHNGGEGAVREFIDWLCAEADKRFPDYGRQ